MKLMEILNLIDGLIHTHSTKSDLNREYQKAFACDLMSDCLAYVNDNCILITGLTNLQALRTVEMLDIDCIIFVRGKKPSEEMISFADQNRIHLLSTTLTMYETSGVLYKAGLESLKI